MSGVEGAKVTKALIMKVPGNLVIEINEMVGFRLVTNFSRTGAINLIKVAPVARCDAKLPPCLASLDTCPLAQARGTWPASVE